MQINSDEKLCPDCKGKRWYWGDDDWPHPCETCSGKGKIKRKETSDEV